MYNWRTKYIHCEYHCLLDANLPRILVLGAFEVVGVAREGGGASEEDGPFMQSLEQKMPSTTSEYFINTPTIIVH